MKLIIRGKCKTLNPRSSKPASAIGGNINGVENSKSAAVAKRLILKPESTGKKQVLLVYISKVLRLDICLKIRELKSVVF